MLNRLRGVDTAVGPKSIELFCCSLPVRSRLVSWLLVVVLLCGLRIGVPSHTYATLQVVSAEEVTVSKWKHNASMVCVSRRSTRLPASTRPTVYVPSEATAPL